MRSISHPTCLRRGNSIGVGNIQLRDTFDLRFRSEGSRLLNPNILQGTVSTQASLQQAKVCGLYQLFRLYSTHHLFKLDHWNTAKFSFALRRVDLSIV